MCNESNIEKLWFMYKTQDAPKGVSINKFCMISNVLYKSFNDWFRKKSLAGMMANTIIDTIVELAIRPTILRMFFGSIKGISNSAVFNTLSRHVSSLVFRSKITSAD